MSTAITAAIMAAVTLGPTATTDTFNDVEDWVPLVQEHFHSRDIQRALAIIRCESGGNQYADNPTSTARGGWQFIRSTWDWVAAELGLPTYRQGGPDNPEHATRAAAWLAYEGGGFRHWACNPGHVEPTGHPETGPRPSRPTPHRMGTEEK